jgi:hypothetical protein
MTKNYCKLHFECYYAIQDDKLSLQILFSHFRLSLKQEEIDE